ncbi:MAG: energy transducer TonB [Candidatus Omnitrophota bacterium]
MNFIKTGIWVKASDKKVLFFTFTISLLLHTVLLYGVEVFFDRSHLQNENIVETKIVELTREEVNKIKERPSLLPEINVIGEVSRLTRNYKSQIPNDKLYSENVEQAIALEHKQNMEIDKAAEEAMLKYQDILKKKIESQRVYPLRAREKGIEGNVGICFNVLRSGQTNNIRISNHSGSELLDQEALDTIKRVNQFPPLPDEIKTDNVNIQVAIVFSLD